MWAANLSQKPGRQEAKQHGIVGLAVEPRHADVTKLPQLALPAVQRPGGERDIDQNNIGTALNKPPPKVDLGENGENGERGRNDFNSLCHTPLIDEGIFFLFIIITLSEKS